jgi:hypothetical protein
MFASCPEYLVHTSATNQQWPTVEANNSWDKLGFVVLGEHMKTAKCQAQTAVFGPHANFFNNDDANKEHI